MGDPNNVLIAAKLPAVAMIATAPGGVSRFTVRIASAASPPPMAINGASGPSTAPSDSVANAARTTPGSSIGSVGPPCWKPPDGEWPEFPGSDRMHQATSSPDNASSGTGHHTGGVSNPSAPGRSANSASWSQSTSARNPYDHDRDRYGDQRGQHECLQVCTRPDDRERIDRVLDVGHRRAKVSNISGTLDTAGQTTVDSRCPVGERSCTAGQLAYSGSSGAGVRSVVGPWWATTPSGRVQVVMRSGVIVRVHPPSWTR